MSERKRKKDSGAYQPLDRPATQAEAQAFLRDVRAALQEACIAHGVRLEACRDEVYEEAGCYTEARVLADFVMLGRPDELEAPPPSPSPGPSSP